MDKLLSLLLNFHKIGFDKEELSFQITSHPSYPSLHTVTGVLDHFDIDNVAVEVPIERNTIEQLPHSFLAQIRYKTSTFFVVVRKKMKSYDVFYADKKNENLAIEEFLERFTGIVVAIEKNEVESAKTRIRIPKGTSAFLIVAAAIFVAIFLYAVPNWVSVAYSLLAAMGVLISWAIVRQEEGETTILGNAFCSDTNAKKNCNSVLFSKGAQIGRYKLSDFSLVYFVGLIVAAWLLNLVNVGQTILYLISLLALPITLYSIYYQYAIAKTWCMLCLSIVGVLCLQGALVLFSGLQIFDILGIANISVWLTAFTFLTVFGVWSLARANIRELKELKFYRTKDLRFKRNFVIFQTLLNKSSVLDTNVGDTFEIVLGNESSPLELLLITSPYCGHCKPVHALMERMLRKHPKKVKLRVLFFVNMNNSVLVEVSSRLLELYETDGKQICMKAMNDIYGAMDPITWLAKWGETNNTSFYHDVLERQRTWCLKNAINFTPAIFINGRSYPRAYDREDLQYFIEDLYEASSDEVVETKVFETYYKQSHNMA
nr:vitamin K epoxide reductase family protein [uncultured Allomuricauda sp.]